MKLALRIICYVLIAAILLPCGYLWTCILSSKISGQPLTIADYRITVTQWAISDMIPAGTLLAITDDTQVIPGEVVLVRTDEGETAGQVLLVQDDKLWAAFGSDTLPLILSADKVVGKAALVSTELGAVVLFLTSPVGVAVTVFIPLALVFMLQTVLVIGRRHKRNKPQQQAEEPAAEEIPTENSNEQEAK